MRFHERKAVVPSVLVSLAFLLFLSFFLTACSDQNIQKGKVNTQSFSLSPKVLTKESILRINLPNEHPSNLAIQSPEGDWYIIHNPEENIFFVSEEIFKTAPYLDVPVFSVQGTTWKDGNKVKELVFQSIGEYQVYIADNLETEPENTFSFTENVKLR